MTLRLTFIALENSLWNRSRVVHRTLWCGSLDLISSCGVTLLSPNNALIAPCFFSALLGLGGTYFPSLDTGSVLQQMAQWSAIAASAKRKNKLSRLPNDVYLEIFLRGKGAGNHQSLQVNLFVNWFWETSTVEPHAFCRVFFLCNLG